jgi:4-hydroxy-tetrahydrodipicolinate reductase
MRLAEIAAPLFDSAEIIELHHDNKRDAPSGTALETARRIAAARASSGAGDFRADPTEVTLLDSVRGGAGPAGLRIHAVRMRGLVAHEEVLFGAAGQTLSIRQDSYDRESFMPGVVLAVRKVASTPGLTVGIDDLLFAT